MLTEADIARAEEIAGRISNRPARVRGFILAARDCDLVAKSLRVLAGISRATLVVRGDQPQQTSTSE